MKKIIAQLIGLIFMGLVLVGCFEVAGPTNAVAEVPIPTSPPPSDTPYIGQIVIVSASAQFTPSAGSMEMTIAVLFTYSGPDDTNIRYSIKGLSCGTSGDRVMLGSDLVTLQDGTIHNAVISYTYSGCSLVLGQTIDLVFIAENMTTGEAFGEPLTITIN